MPPHDGVGLREDERGAPVGPHPGQRDLEQTVRRLESRPPTAGALQGAQLLPERQILQDDLAMPAERQCERSAEDEEQGQHAAIVAGLDAKINKDDLWRRTGFTFEQQADDVAAILDQERVEQADLLGQSDGGIIALVFGIRHPQRARKIIASAPNLWPEKDALWEWSIEDMKRDVAGAERMIAAGDKSRDWPLLKRQVEQDLYEPHVSLDSVCTITAPTLLIGADEDVTLTKSKLRDQRKTCDDTVAPSATS